MTTLNAEYTRYLFLNAELWCLNEIKRLPTASNNRTLLGTTSWYCSRTALRHQNCGVPYCLVPSTALRHQNCSVLYCPVPSTALRHQNCGVPYCPVPSTALRHQNCGVPKMASSTAVVYITAWSFRNARFSSIQLQVTKTWRHAPSLLWLSALAPERFLIHIQSCNTCWVTGHEAGRPAGLQLVNENATVHITVLPVQSLVCSRAT